MHRRAVGRLESVAGAEMKHFGGNHQRASRRDGRAGKGGAPVQHKRRKPGATPCAQHVRSIPRQSSPTQPAAVEEHPPGDGPPAAAHQVVLLEVGGGTMGRQALTSAHQQPRGSGPEVDTSLGRRRRSLPNTARGLATLGPLAEEERSGFSLHHQRSGTGSVAVASGCCKRPRGSCLLGQRRRRAPPRNRVPPHHANCVLFPQPGPTPFIYICVLCRSTPAMARLAALAVAAAVCAVLMAAGEAWPGRHAVRHDAATRVPRVGCGCPSEGQVCGCGAPTHFLPPTHHSRGICSWSGSGSRSCLEWDLPASRLTPA